MISLHEFLIHVIGNSIVFFPISVLKTSVVIGSDLNLGPTFYALHLLLYKYVFHIIFVHLQVVIGMSAMLNVFVVDISVA